MDKMIDDSPYPRIECGVERPLLPLFNMLLQQGVAIRARTGCSVAAFLREELGAGTGTIEKIQSIVLDGSPVDDIETSIVHDGAVLALSAAMPGLVGATLRRGGAYASFRSAITYHETAAACAMAVGTVRIKIFNLLMAELGPALLARGVIVSARDFRAFAAEESPLLRSVRRLSLDGQGVTADILADCAWLSGKEAVVLTVTAV